MKSKQHIEITLLNYITCKYTFLNTYKKKEINRNLNYQYGLNRYTMKFAGIWPEERKWNRASSYIVLMPFLTMLCFACGPQTIDLPFIAHDLNLVVENLSMANVTLTISLVKTMTFWMNGKHFAISGNSRNSRFASSHNWQACKFYYCIIIK
ncbi:hypothetical protein E2986_11814 [Frieseomelitta varia]|uniref:Uncharacterized protein n=1 Tax=Frieseomelitta varia TaxID=561572 RepID=A0A833RW17_9HYME|nr:hypothetical protein E2986_11814 [Frieseomelitta varia]